MMAERVLVVAPTLQGTGNHTTCMRIAQGLMSRPMEEDGTSKRLPAMEVSVVGALKPRAKKEILQKVQKGRVRCLIGLHALKAGRHLIDQKLPYAIIIGGTDVNEYEFLDTPSKKIVQTCLQKARIIIAFSRSLRNSVLKMSTNVKSKIRIIPQAVQIPHLCTPLAQPEVSFEADEKPHTPRSHVFFLPASIRAVKDPLYLVQAFKTWHQSYPHLGVTLRIAGAPLDSKMVAKLKRECGPGVEYVGLLTREQTIGEMRRCAAVINSSVSEGMSGVILEAMALGKSPVIVRAIEGNLDIVSHNKTGYTYKTPKKFLAIAKAIVEYRNTPTSEAKRKTVDERSGVEIAPPQEVIENAVKVVRSEHSTEKEATE
ncbi:hypothetical protein AAMO2058_000750100 [Amorphochlora amoebiformis]